MTFTHFFIRRPAFTIVMMAMMVMTGLISYQNLPVRWVPNISVPVISIFTSYPGASASLIENQITTPIEAALSGIDGVETISSASNQGQSSITLNFKLGRNMDAVVEDVRSSLSRVTGVLPRDAEAPIVSKADIGGMPILYLAFSDDHRSSKEVSDYLQQFIIPRLQTVEGVALITTYGRQVSALRIWLDPQKMTASNVTVDDVTRTLQDQNIEVPSGAIRGLDRYYNVVTNETLTSASQFNDLILRNDQNQIVRLKNIGEAVIAPAELDTAFRVSGKPAVALGVIPQSTANPLNVAQHIFKAKAEITAHLPAGMHAEFVYDGTTFIHDSIHSVYEAIFEAMLFVLIVIYLFLGNWRSTIIPIATIPVCLVATFSLLQLFHFSINTITLMAFVLAIGLVVDDAIVMLENITRHIESGMTPFAAALKGSHEMIFPIIAMTLTLAAVYAPISFTSGIMGSVFAEFALTLAGAVVVSGLVALTLSPMMCARLLKPIQHKSRYREWLQAFSSKLAMSYKNLLLITFAHRKKLLVILFILSLVGFGIYRSLPAELMPMENRDEVNVWVSAPHDASFRYTNFNVQQLEKIYANMPEIKSYFSEVGEGSAASAYQIINLQPQAKRHLSADAFVNKLNQQLEKIPGITAYASVPPPPLAWFASEGQGRAVAMAVMSAGEYRELHDKMTQLVAAAKQYPGFLYADSSLKWDRNQFDLNINRDKAADLKVPMLSIANTISTLIAGRNAGKFEYGGKQYDIMVQMNESALSNPNIISQLYVRNDNNMMVSLADLITMQETTSPGYLPHFERMRADTFYASLAPGYTIADAVNFLQNLAQATLPDNMKINFMGDARNYLEANNKMLVTFLLALMFIYLVLVAQFESFIDPFIILLTVPFAVIGAFLSLKLSGGTLNIYSEIGLVTLIGLIAKHGILITEFANLGRAAGKSIQDAIIDAAQLRLRPILMTTMAMMLGALPLALAFGSGAETRHQIGWVIVGGLFIGTFFSLIVVPVAYTYLAKFKKLPPLLAADKMRVNISDTEITL